MHNTSENERIGPLLRRVSRLANRVYRQQIEELGLTARQAAAILALREEPGMTLRRLADVLGADQATASILVDRLCSSGLVTRVTDQSDRRRVQLFPNEQALRLAEQLEPARAAAEKLIEEALGPRDTQTVRRLLGRLRAFLEGRKAAPVEAGRNPSIKAASASRAPGPRAQAQVVPPSVALRKERELQ